MSHIRVSHVSRTNVSYHTSALALQLVEQPSYCTHKSVITHIQMSGVCQAWLIYKWGMTHLQMRHDSFTNEAWLISKWGMTHLHMRHASFTYEACLIYIWGMTHFTNEACLLYATQHTHKSIMTHIQVSMRVMMRTNESCLTYATQ